MSICSSQHCIKNTKKIPRLAESLQKLFEVFDNVALMKMQPNIGLPAVALPIFEIFCWN